MKNYLTLWDEGWQDRNARILKAPIAVIGERIHGAGSEFRKVRLTLHPANTFEVDDRVKDKEELEKLNVGWPDSFILGMLGVLMNAEPDPLTGSESPWNKFGITMLTLLAKHFLTRDTMLGAKSSRSSTEGVLDPNVYRCGRHRPLEADSGATFWQLRLCSRYVPVGRNFCVFRFLDVSILQ